METKKARRAIYSHLIEADKFDSELYVEAIEPRGSGNANNIYHLSYRTPYLTNFLGIKFLSRPLTHPDGPDGITIEMLLAVCKDRLEGFQSGPFSCESNQIALDSINKALEALHSRTRERKARGVEGQEKA